MYSREQVLEVVGKLRVNRFDVVLVENGKAALDQILEMVPAQLTVGVANSVTVRQIGVLEALKRRGNMVVDPISQNYQTVDFDEKTFMQTYRETLGTDVFISGTNAVTEDGKLVNIDGVGNRVAGIIWGSRKSIVVVGRNKIVKNTDEAIDRIKNVIAPTISRRRQFPLPCAKLGKCVDCNVPARACNITVIIEKRPVFTEVTVVMVDEDLGLGWDPGWPKEEIERIRVKYEEFDWPYASAYQSYKSTLKIGP
jgi:hypothetical protein